MKRKVQLIVNNGQPFIQTGQKERNKPCRCGSGKKAKNCCGMDKKYEQIVPRGTY